MKAAACLFLMILVLPLTNASASADVESDLATRERIAKRFPGVSAEDVRMSPVEGLYEVTIGPMVMYASADGRYLVKGEIYDLETDRNVTESRIAQARARSLEQLANEDLVVFGEPDARHTVTVFTDVSCTYCRLFHSKIDEYTRRGIQVRYAAFPRNGLGSQAWQEMEAVWCAPDRRAALTAAKLDKEFETKECATDLVAMEWRLGRMLGVQGTPAIFTPNGQMIPGYLPPDVLLKKLESIAGKR